jgi:hypothetical protein
VLAATNGLGADIDQAVGSADLITQAAMVTRRRTHRGDRRADAPTATLLVPDVR